MDIGLTITNIGPKVAFIDPAQADPQPTNLTLGVNYRVIDSEFNKLSLIYDVNKLLVASYPDMDWNGDGIIGGCDDDGHCTNIPRSGDYNKDGDQEKAHTNPVYLAIFTSWVDDWLLGGDTDFTGNGEIGGFDLNGFQTDSILFGEQGYGKYGCEGQSDENAVNQCDANNLVLEVGTGDDRTINNELEKLVHNFGMEYWYSKYFALRAGYYFDQSGKISNPTFGVGLRFSGYGFDFGYTSGKPGHPLANTMRFSLNWEF